MTASVRQRVEQVTAEIIQKHLDLLLLMMAEAHVEPPHQRERIGVLVRCLHDARIEDTIFQSGRRVPMSLDASTRPPVLRLNAELLERVDDDELFSAFTRPISELLELSPVNVGLVLQGRDARQLRNLYHGGRGRLDGPVLLAASIREVIEQRGTVFVGRLRELVETLASGQTLEAPAPDAFIDWLQECQGQWPDWYDVADQRFVQALVEATGAALDGVTGRLPPAEALVELCWESLNLSPQSFLRHAARGLRTREQPVDEALLGAIARVMAPAGQVEQLTALERWPSLQDLQEAWFELNELELQTLGSHHHGSRQIPSISVIESPRDSMQLREPEELPWRYPLVCWSVRESNALRDLLQGFVQTQRAAQQRDEEDLELLLVEDASSSGEAPVRVDAPTRQIQIQVVGKNIEMPPGYEVMSARAFDAVCARLERQLMETPKAQRAGVLTRIRGAYDGFFMGTRHVWERRLQGWQNDLPEVALRRLLGAVGELLACPVLFDPFESPASIQLRMMPTFCFIVATSPHLDKAPFRVPVSVLATTAATGTPPLRVRMIEVPGGAEEPCRWLCDRELTMDTMQGQPVKQTLNAVEDNMLRMIAFE